MATSQSLLRKRTATGWHMKKTQRISVSNDLEGSPMDDVRPSSGERECERDWSCWMVAIRLPSAFHALGRRCSCFGGASRARRCWLLPPASNPMDREPEIARARAARRVLRSLCRPSSRASPWAAGRPCSGAPRRRRPVWHPAAGAARNRPAVPQRRHRSRARRTTR